MSCPHFSVIRLLKNTVVNGGRKRRRTTKDARKVFLLSSNINIAWYKDTTDTSRLQYYSTHYRLCRQERQYCSTCLTQYVDSRFIIQLKNPLVKQHHSMKLNALKYLDEPQYILIKITKFHSASKRVIWQKKIKLHTCIRQNESFWSFLRKAQDVHALKRFLQDFTNSFCFGFL